VKGAVGVKIEVFDNQIEGALKALKRLQQNEFD